jgi:hypothetical protein
MLMFAWSAHSPAARSAVAHVPFVRSSMFDKVVNGYAAEGSVAMLRGPMSGIPYKIYAVEAPGRVPAGVFALMSVPARLERFVLTAATYAVIGAWLRRRNAPPWTLVTAWAVHWTIVYVIYWGIL